MAEKQIGKVAHYFGHIGVAALSISDRLAIGDVIHIRGHTTDVTQRVDSMQIDHKPVQEVTQGQDVAIKVVQPVREHDLVYLVEP